MIGNQRKLVLITEHNDRRRRDKKSEKKLPACPKSRKKYGDQHQQKQREKKEREKRWKKQQKNCWHLWWQQRCWSAVFWCRHLQQIQMTAQVPMQMLHLLEQRWKLFGHDLEVKVENRTDVFDMKYKRWRYSWSTWKSEERYENYMACFRLSLSGTWIVRDRTSDSADGSILHGNSVLLCKEFPEAAWLVHRNEFI